MTTTVRTVTQLRRALARAKRGDVIQLKPGIYRIHTPLDLPSGVHLIGAAS